MKIYIRRELQEFQPDLIHIATPFNIGLAGLYNRRIKQSCRKAEKKM